MTSPYAPVGPGGPDLSHPIHTSILDYTPSTYNALEPSARAEVEHQKALQYLRDVQAWNAAANRPPASAAPTGAAPSGAPSGGGGAAGGAGTAGAPTGNPMLDALHQQYNDQVAQVNKQFDAQLAHLEQTHGAGAAGVKNVGQELQQRLAALAGDARARTKGANKAVKGDYAAAQAGTAKVAADLLADLERQGASTHALSDEANARRSAIGASGALSSELGSRYAQLLDQSLNNRQAEGRQGTAGALDQLQTLLAGAKSDTELKRGNELSDLLMQLHQAEADQAAAAHGGGGRGGGGGGRGGGGSGSGGSLSRTDIQALTPDYGGAFKSLLKGSNYEQRWAQAQLHALSSGMTPQQLWAQFQQAEAAGKHIGFYHTDAKNAILAAADEQKNKTQLAKALGLIP